MKLFLFILITTISVFSQNIEDRLKVVDEYNYIEIKNDKSIQYTRYNWFVDPLGWSKPIICNSEGDYIFNVGSNFIWTDLDIYTKSYKLMKNGYIYNPYKCTHGLNDIIVLPQPQSTCKYYVFQTDAGIYLKDTVLVGYEYQIIDMKLDNGKGEVIQKNIKLNDSTCSALAAIPSKDKKSYWIISIDYPSRDLNVHQFTKVGVRKINANTYKDSELFNFINYGYSQTQANNPRQFGLPFVEMKVNQQHNLIGIVGVLNIDGSNKVAVKIYNFDNETGKISYKYQLINSEKNGHHVLCFSPDGMYLYFGQSIFDLSLESEVEIQNSEYIHGLNLEGITTDPYNRIIAINHHRLYIFDYDGVELNKELITDQMYYSGSIGLHNGFSIFPSIYLNNLEKVITITKEGKTKYCSGETVIINTTYEPEFDEVTHFWYNSSGDMIGVKDLIIEDVKKEDKGWYYFEISAACGVNSKRDSIYIEVQELEPLINSNNTSLCVGDSATLSLDKEYEIILWNTGETTKDIIVKDGGIYSATVTEGECTNDTSIEIIVNPLPEIDLLAPNGTILCDGGSVEIEVIVGNGIGLLWNDGSRIKKRTFNESGTFSVTAKDINTGCEITKEIVISEIGNTKAEILGINEICSNKSTTLTITPQGQSYLWNNGETTQTIVVNQGGIYSATITTEAGCELSDDIEVIEYPNPEFEIKGDKIICNNSTELYVEESFESYLWSTGATAKFIIVDEPGSYSVTITDINGCRSENEVEVIEETPDLNLSTNNIDFGEILFGQIRTQTITADKAIIKTQDTKYFDATINNQQIFFIFNPNDIGEFLDTLIVESLGDCKARDTIYIKGICKAEILAKVSNSEGYPNDDVVNKVSLELQQQIPLPIDFNYEIKLNINQDAIQIIDNTTFSYTNNKLEIDINDYIIKNNYNTDIKDINSKIMLARNHDNPIEIVSFTTDNPYLNPLRQDGMIKIYEVCIDESRLIKYYNPAEILKLNKTTLTLNTKEEGTYSIEISDIKGKSIYKKVENGIGIINFNYQLSNGSYLIKINEPGKTQTLKVIFME